MTNNDWCAIKPNRIWLMKTKLKGFKYYDLIQIILFNIIRLSYCFNNYSKCKSNLIQIICTQLDGFKYFYLILLYTLPVNINGYVPFLILLYTLPMNINGYVLFLIVIYPTLWTLMGMSHSSYLWTLMGMSHSSYCYIPYLWT